MRIIFCLLLLSSLSAEPITRASGTKAYPLAAPAPAAPPAYPWNAQKPITKQHFRCKGCSSNPPIGEITDCGGWHRHSLPTKDGQEFIYPILINLLNHIQTTTRHPVIITAGHRCPKHNTYVDPTNPYSKHLIGAEVSFYVPGLDALALVPIIQDYYKGTDMAAFKRFEGKTNVSTLPWSNKEIFIKLFLPTEGRNSDNTHSYPYLSIQVRYDRDKNEPVTYNWAAANRGFYQK